MTSSPNAAPLLMWLTPALLALLLYGLGQGFVKMWITEVPPARFVNERDRLYRYVLCRAVKICQQTDCQRLPTDRGCLAPCDPVSHGFD
jgi:hypothetical protein